MLPLSKKRIDVNSVFYCGLFCLLLGNTCVAQKINVKKQFDNAAVQAGYMLTAFDSAKANGAAAELVSIRTIEKNKLKLIKAQDWTSGFFAGELWFLYEQTGEKEWLEAAKKFTAWLEPVKLVL
jgi:unsaturated chondroitin disaccharide hydrolase